MIDLNPEHWEIVKRLLSEYFPEVEARIFGSRVHGKARPYSDLDVVLVGKEKLDWRRIERLKDALAESNLPIMVDVLDGQVISPEFRRVIESGCVILQEGKRSRGVNT